MSKYTPGPWNNLGPRILARDPTIRDVAKAVDGSEFMATAVCYDIIEANARLIAAAPDLLEACQVVLGYMPDMEDGPVSTCEIILEEAIAKATGETNDE